MEKTVNEQGNDGGSITVELPGKSKREPKPTFDPAYIRDLSERAYRIALGDGEAERMIKKDKDDGRKMRNRAGAYDTLTRIYLDVLGFQP